jgi:hypothetical protein
MSSSFRTTIFEILDQSKDSGIVSDLKLVDRDICYDLNLSIENDKTIKVNREQRIDLAMRVIEHGAELVTVVELMTWKDFEGLVASILGENNFRCIESFRRKGNKVVRGMEIDVIGVRGYTILSIDAKMWGVRSGKTSALKTASEKQKERTVRLTTQLGKLSERISTLRAGEYRFFPVVVTWLVEEVEINEGVPVVPVFKLNSFIQDFDKYEDLLVSYTGQL